MHGASELRERVSADCFTFICTNNLVVAFVSTQNVQIYRADLCPYRFKIDLIFPGAQTKSADERTFV